MVVVVLVDNNEPAQLILMLNTEWNLWFSSRTINQRVRPSVDYYIERKLARTKVEEGATPSHTGYHIERKSKIQQMKSYG